MAYNNSNSGTLGKNDRMREGKKDAEYRGQCEIHCPHCNRNFGMWLDAWVNVGGPNSKKPGQKFFGLKFKPKDDPGAGPANRPAPTAAPRMSSQPSAPPRTAPAVPIGDPANPSGYNPASDPDGEQVPF